jgi:hypothetical protein
LRIFRKGPGERRTAFVFEPLITESVVRKINKLGRSFKLGPTFRGVSHGLDLETEGAILAPGRLLLGPPLGQRGVPFDRTEKNTSGRLVIWSDTTIFGWSPNA